MALITLEIKVIITKQKIHFKNSTGKNGIQLSSKTECGILENGKFGNLSV